VLIALEVNVMNQIKVFVNPYDYLLDSVDYFGYVINHEAPKNEDINGIDLSSNSAENFCIMEYIIKQEQTINKKDYKKLQNQLVKSLLEEKNSIKSEKIYYDNYFTTKKPVPLSQARVKGPLDKSIEDHIIVCGLVTGIKNLILPLRMKSLGT
jgi:potassium large conductance calcium-activated channel subfamily M alpha protein 1